MQITPYLKQMIQQCGSDLFFITGAPVNLKIEGSISPLGEERLKPGETTAMANEIMSEKQRHEFESEMEQNFALSAPGIGRFRVNIYRQRGEVSMVLRHIKTDVPTIEQLNLPNTLKDLVMRPRGLILVVGGTGSGKSSTLASMIDYRNENHNSHILTIEDPIEFVYRHKRSIIDQREIGFDTKSYSNALMNAMREAPDVILIGEIRDAATMQHAVAYAETGHLCLATLHANNAYQALERILNFFPDSAHHQLLEDLSSNLRAIISQRLIPSKSHKRIPAVEVMLASPLISDLIGKGDVEKIHDAMLQSGDNGMQTFDQHIYQLWRRGHISDVDALQNADSRNNLQLRFRLEVGEGVSVGDIFSIDKESDKTPPST